MSENVISSLKLMGMGMAAIFLVIIVIYIVVNLMLILTTKKHDNTSGKKHDNTSQTSNMKSDDENRDEIIAVIAAVLSCARESNPYGFIERNVK
jgi:Na+-transporting methylmalonyl-CoA/oxaloacetate decarboxylase gamma subunit